MLARQVATLPARIGGLGLRDALRTATGAYWASWVDALPVLQKKAPCVTARILGTLEGHADGVACLEAFMKCRQQLCDEGAADLPSWREASEGARPPQRPNDLAAAPDSGE